MIENTEHDATAPAAPLAANQLLFGGRGGSFKGADATGGKELSVYGDRLVDMIQIGDTKYGGGGGELRGTAKIPADGTVNLVEIGTRSCVICYLSIRVGKTLLEVGDRGASDASLVLSELAVRFAGISGDKYVDRLIFDIV